MAEYTQVHKFASAFALAPASSNPSMSQSRSQSIPVPAPVPPRNQPKHQTQILKISSARACRHRDTASANTYSVPSRACLCPARLPGLTSRKSQVMPPPLWGSPTFHTVRSSHQSRTLVLSALPRRPEARGTRRTSSYLSAAPTATECLPMPIPYCAIVR